MFHFLVDLGYTVLVFWDNRGAIDATSARKRSRKNGIILKGSKRTKGSSMWFLIEGRGRGSPSRMMDGVGWSSRISKDWGLNVKGLMSRATRKAHVLFILLWRTKSESGCFGSCGWLRIICGHTHICYALGDLVGVQAQELRRYCSSKHWSTAPLCRMHRSCTLKLHFGTKPETTTGHEQWGGRSCFKTAQLFK